MSDCISYEDAASTSLCVQNGKYSNRLFRIGSMVYIRLCCFVRICVLYIIMASSLSMSDEDEITSPIFPRPTRFTIDGEIRRQYRRFNTAGTELTVHLLPPLDDDNHMSHFQASVTELFEYALRDCQDSDMVGLTILTKSMYRCGVTWSRGDVES